MKNSPDTSFVWQAFHLRFSMVNDDAKTNIQRKRQRLEDLMLRNKADLTAAEESVLLYRQKGYELKTLMNDTTPPISSLSIEIISEIFILACSGQTSSRGNCKPVQFHIGSVCKSWQNLAWTTPLLWRRVVIRLSQSRFDTQRRLLEEWIDRGANLPLKLLFTLDRSTEWRIPKDAFETIKKSCHRWEELECPSLVAYALSWTKGGESLEFMLLQTLCVNMNHIRNQPHSRTLNFKSSPRLRDLQILDILPPKHLILNWSTS